MKYLLCTGLAVNVLMSLSAPAHKFLGGKEDGLSLSPA